MTNDTQRVRKPLAKKEVKEHNADDNGNIDETSVELEKAVVSEVLKPIDLTALLLSTDTGQDSTRLESEVTEQASSELVDDKADKPLQMFLERSTARLDTSLLASAQMMEKPAQLSEQGATASISKASEMLKELLPEVSDRQKLKSDILKQLSVNQQDSQQVTKDAHVSEALALEEQVLLEEDKVNDFVTRILERLNDNKIQQESLSTARTIDEKSQINSDFLEQINNKVTGDLPDKANMSPALANALNQRANNVNLPAQMTMNAHINQPEWGSEFGKRIQFMLNNNIQTAELRLDPPELGRINIKINLSNEHANVSFASAHQTVRDAIETTIPRLRELLAESGLQLGNADVASQFQQQGREQEQAEADGNLSAPILPSVEEELAIQENFSGGDRSLSIDGVIDYFA